MVPTPHGHLTATLKTVQRRRRCVGGVAPTRSVGGRGVRVVTAVPRQPAPTRPGTVDSVRTMANGQAAKSGHVSGIARWRLAATLVRLGLDARHRGDADLARQRLGEALTVSPSPRPIWLSGQIARLEVLLKEPVTATATVRGRGGTGAARSSSALVGRGREREAGPWRESLLNRRCRLALREEGSSAMAGGGVRRRPRPGRLPQLPATLADGRRRGVSRLPCEWPQRPDGVGRPAQPRPPVKSLSARVRRTTSPPRRRSPGRDS